MASLLQDGGGQHAPLAAIAIVRVPRMRSV